MSKFFYPKSSAEHVATFNDLKAMNLDTDGVQLFVLSGEKFVPADTFSAESSYALTDRDGNTLWVSFDDNGWVWRAESYGRSNPQILLPHLATEMTTKEDDAYLEPKEPLIGQAATRPATKKLWKANDPQPSSPAIESAADQLVRQLIG